MRGERVAGFDGIDSGFAGGAETKDDAGRDCGIRAAGRGGNGEGAEREAFEAGDIGLEEASEVQAEIVQGEVRNGYAAGEVFQINDGILQFQELLATVLKIVHLITGL